ncbi:hypothetical protein K503DRAFT_571144 [Rhizopogon vinicolor AM-OR11-026]|uniref:Uncharacterized protein n=1 Tax=Rhizopogon vinicolor AM-OR11-026 TaxID=1314800 RepID=A0A1B7MJT2_9AGAM|nr:hypothetical protein K503DRAFT_571144 [Rhizopogon vinicolor AM-OR11-026]
MPFSRTPRTELYSLISVVLVGIFSTQTTPYDTPWLMSLPPLPDEKTRCLRSNMIYQPEETAYLNYAVNICSELPRLPGSMLKEPAAMHLSQSWCVYTEACRLSASGTGTL